MTDNQRPRRMSSTSICSHFDCYCCLLLLLFCGSLVRSVGASISSLNRTVITRTALFGDLEGVLNANGTELAIRGQNILLFFSSPRGTWDLLASNFLGGNSDVTWSSIDTNYLVSLSNDYQSEKKTWSTTAFFYDPSAQSSTDMSVASVGSGTGGLLASSNKYIAIYTGSTLSVLYKKSGDWQSIYSYKSSSVQAIAISNDTLVIGFSSSVSVLTCSTSTCSSTGTWSLPGLVLAISGNYVFIGNLSTITVYKRSTSWSSTTPHFLLSTPPSGVGNNEVFGVQVTISMDGTLLLVVTNKYGHIYYFNGTDWGFQYSVLLGTSQGTGTITSASIAKTTLGYLFLFTYNPSCSDCSSSSQSILNKVGCSPNSYGISCKNCSCVNGVCYTSMWGTSGKCLSCSSPIWYGPDCNNVVMCVNGIASSGVGGTGLCLSCTSILYKPITPTPANLTVAPFTGWYGSTCSKNCTCQFGKCNDGINGNGTCSECWEGFYGSNCSKRCFCLNGCLDGIEGNGTCITCNSNSYGTLCDKPCQCVTNNGICRGGVSGNGLCSSCLEGYYGDTCNHTCTCLNGTCNYGPSGDGLCLSCDPGFFGANCSQQSTCQNGSANEGINGNGECTSCSDSYFGKNCENYCTCQELQNCLDGIDGTGFCLTCTSPTKWGPNCSNNCTCGFGLCDSGVTGQGTCLTCDPFHYGSNCTQPCLCNTTNGNCNSQIVSDGLCLACKPGWFGPFCNNPCTCKNGTCDYGVSRNGTCLSCDPWFAGMNCDVPCGQCTEGCSEGVMGDGTCLACLRGSFGPYCRNCTCLHGICDDGTNGTGRCLPHTYCENGFYGPDCNFTCACNDFETLCLNVTEFVGDGNCMNECSYNTHDCEQICLKRIFNKVNNWDCSCNTGYLLGLNGKSCSICPHGLLCESNLATITDLEVIINSTRITSDFTATKSNVTLINSTFYGSSSFSSSTIYLQGNENRFVTMSLLSSEVFDSSGTKTVVQGSLSATNTNFYLSSLSQFTFDGGCLNFTNTSLTFVDGGGGSDIDLFTNLTGNCTNPDFSKLEVITTGCRKGQVTQKIARTSLIFKVSYDNSQCESSPPPPILLIAIFSVLGAIVVVVVVVLFAMKCHSISSQLFPYRLKPPEHFTGY